MKRSFPVNINGRIYNIDEDAYRLLDEYLNQLRATFASDDEREIVEDIEARINEHFGETVSDNAIITLEDVTSVISIMGKPDELGCDIDSETNTQPDVSTGTTPPPYNPGGNCQPPAFKVPKRLYRRLDDKVLGGVVSGIATYFGWNLVLLRLLIVVLALVTAVGPFVVVYIIAWIIIPPANTPRRRLEMMGQPVTPDNIGRNLTSQYDPRLDAVDNRSGLSTVGDIFNIILKGVVGFFSFIAGCVGVSTLMAAIVCLLVALGVSITSPEFMHEVFDIEVNGVGVHGFSEAAALSLAGMICLCISIPALALTWAGACVVLGAKMPAKNVIITTVIIEVLLVLGTVLVFFFTAPAASASLATISAVPLAIH